MFFNNGFLFYSMMGGWSTWQWVKVAFFQKVRLVFQNSQSPKKTIPKNYPELEI
jgi:hypothetical protein